MANLSKKIRFAVISVFALLIGVFALTGCGSVEATIKFMVPEAGNGEFRVYEEVQVNKDGTFELPKEPEEYGYTFRNWYTDAECSSKFEAEKVKKDTTVYALMTKVTVAVEIKDGNGEKQVIEEQALVELDALKKAQEKKAEEANLTFDGWYTNAECTTPYDKELGAVKLYAQYVATVVFDNSYEALKTVKVAPGTKIDQPEISEIKKAYMAEDDIYFVDENNEIFDFNTEIKTNTVIRVLWKTPNLEIVPIEGTNQYRINGFDTKLDKEVAETWPVVSLPSRVTIDGELKEVVSYSGSNLYLARSARKIIVNEGIKYIYGLSSGPFASVCEEIQLPKSLLIMEASINGFEELKKVNLEEGLEVIIDSFWKDHKRSYDRHQAYLFDITVPASVNNISLVPNTLKYATGSVFSNDGNFVYKNDAELGKVLVSAHESAIDGEKRLVIADDVKAIQVGSLFELSYDYLILPASFNAISYNNERSNYDFYTGHFLTNLENVAVGSNPSQDKQMDVRAYSIVSDLEDHKYVTLAAQALPETINEYAFNNKGKKYSSLSNINVVFVGEVAEGEVNVRVRYINEMDGPKAKEVVIPVTVGEKITKDQVLEAAGLTEELLGYKFKIDSLNQFGLDYDFNQTIKSNQYIDIAYSYSATGFTTIENEDGTLTVTGFDKETAQLLENSTYLVVIPASKDGKAIVAINDSAFENVLEISQVYIASSVKKIGAKAFRNTKNLEVVDIKTGGLEEIGEAAFEYAGAMEQDGKWVVNPDLAKVDYKKTIPGLTIKLPLGNMKSIAPRAFNTPSIRSFTKTAEESARTNFTAFNIWPDVNDKIEVGGFYFQNGTGILKVTNISAVPDKDGNVIHDVDFVASAGGDNSTAKYSFGLLIKKSFAETSGYIRYTIKEGSVALYEPTLSMIAFAIMKSVEKNAFVYVNEIYTTVNENSGKNKINYMQEDDAHTILPFSTKSQITTQDPEIFAEGWFMGKPNSEVSNMMAQCDNYGGTTPGM